MEEIEQMFEHELEERCFQFAKQVRTFTKKLRRTVESIEDIKQLVRCSASVGSNYIEANEKLGQGDLKYRIKVSRKEAKESMLFLGLLEQSENEELEMERKKLIQEALELRKIFSAMIINLKASPK